MRLSAHDRRRQYAFFLLRGTALTGHRRMILQYQCSNGSFESLIEIKSIEEGR
jgi:hypothetical protein